MTENNRQLSLEKGKTVDTPAISFVQRLFQPVDIAFLVYFRVLFGTMMLVQSLMYLCSHELEAKYVTPEFHFKYWGFSWVEPWPEWGMQGHILGLAILGIFIVLGCYYRACMALLCAGFTYLFLIDKAYYQNHYYLICLISFVMIFLPAERALSIDKLRNPQIASNTTPVWTLWILRFLIAIPYFFGGIAKLNPDWLRGEPMRIWLYLGELKGIPHAFHEEWMVWLLSYGGLLFDLFIVPLLLWRKTRWTAYFVAVLFHLMNATMFYIGVFPWMMISATLLFFPPSWPRFAGWRKSSSFVPVPQSPVAAPLTRRQKGTVVALAVFVSLQILIPLRHLVYPGYGVWNGKGTLFAWRMKLDDKVGDLRFLVKNLKTGRVSTVHPNTVLRNIYQPMGLVQYPDMQLQLGHYLNQIYSELYGEKVEVRVTGDISLNGRPGQPMIDPNADLTAVPWTLFGPTSWIEPLRQPLPSATESRDYWRKIAEARAAEKKTFRQRLDGPAVLLPRNKKPEFAEEIEADGEG